MADALSLAAVLAMAYAGRKLSETPQVEKKTLPPVDFLETSPGIVTPSGQVPRKMEQKNFSDITWQTYAAGEPVRDLSNRMNVSGKMNNLAPAEKQFVGPGLGVGPDVPAYGGYQQLFRIKPNNVGAERLTTLRGGVGPAHNTTGGMPAVRGEITNFGQGARAVPIQQGSAGRGSQGFDFVPHRGQQTLTQRQTNRSTTTTMGGALEYRPALSIIPQRTMTQHGTRNKSDCTTINYTNPSMPHGTAREGYTNSPAGLYLQETRDCENGLEKGMRVCSDRRGKCNRDGNAGRMNVRAGPLGAGGAVTKVRQDSNRMNGWVPVPNAGRTGQYVPPAYQNLNAFKGRVNPNACAHNLSVAQRNLKGNPYVPP